MTDIPAQALDGVPTYLERGDPTGRFAGYHPTWINDLAVDVTLEGSLLDGALLGAEAVRTVIGAARELYDRQDFNYVGYWGDNRFLEDYTAAVAGAPLGAIHLITFNAAAQVRHIAVHYRPLSSLMLFSRLLRDKLADTPYANYYLESET